jgi:hypothetical protein
MPKKYKIIEDAMKATSSVAPAPPKPPKELTANKSIKQKMNVDRLANKRANSETPKNNGAVFSPKPEPNRGTGSERRPSVPRNHNTRPTMEGKESEYGANKELTGTFKLATIKNTMQKKSGLSDYHSHNDKLTQKKSVKEDAGAVSVGSGAVAGITDPTTNYAFQVLKKKQNKLARRKKPVGEEFSAGIGNTQAPADSKKTSDKKSLSSFKKRKGDKVASPPNSPSDVDTSPAIGGQ